MNNETITEVTSYKHLGIFSLTMEQWHEHINYITAKAWIRINVMRKLKFQLDRRSFEIIDISFIKPLLELMLSGTTARDTKLMHLRKYSLKLRVS